MHYTECDLSLALKILTDPTAVNRVSAHYVISEEGEIIQLVEEDCIAWHAGQSYWAGRTHLNRCSIGIELVNPGHGPNYRPFSKAQMEALVELSQDIQARYPIPLHHILAHSDIAPQRKQDPGELFDWDFLADHGLGIAPRSLDEPCEIKNRDPIQLLQESGYEIPDPLSDAQQFNLILAFQMHFIPTATLGTLCDQTIRRMVNLHHRINDQKIS